MRTRVFSERKKQPALSIVSNPKTTSDAGFLCVYYHRTRRRRRPTRCRTPWPSSPLASACAAALATGACMFRCLEMDGRTDGTEEWTCYDRLLILDWVVLGWSLRLGYGRKKSACGSLSFLIPHRTRINTRPFPPFPPMSNPFMPLNTRTHPYSHTNVDRHTGHP